MKEKTKHQKLNEQAIVGGSQIVEKSNLKLSGVGVEGQEGQEGQITLPFCNVSSER